MDLDLQSHRKQRVKVDLDPKHHRKYQLKVDLDLKNHLSSVELSVMYPSSSPALDWSPVFVCEIPCKGVCLCQSIDHPALLILEFQ